jgi:hypothetical protein
MNWRHTVRCALAGPIPSWPVVSALASLTRYGIPRIAHCADSRVVFALNPTTNMAPFSKFMKKAAGGFLICMESYLRVVIARKEIKERERIAETARIAARLREDESDDGPPKKRAYIPKNFARAALAVEEDYYGPSPLFNDRQFERVFRVTRAIADSLLTGVAAANPFFRQTEDAIGKPSICPKVKLLMALKLLAYGVSPSAFVDYFQMGEETGRRCLYFLTEYIASDEELQQRYLRRMNRSDARRLSELHQERHGIKGMIGSLDCMHVFWRTCPVAWQGSFRGAKGKPSLLLEALVDHNLWFWSASFGNAGAINDINAWDRSPLLKALIDGSFHSEVDFEFTIGNQSFHKMWIMVDGIYPELSRFVKTVKNPETLIDQMFAKWQESSRKDVERGFGVLQRKFQILVRAIECWDITKISKIVTSCIVLHNMMIKSRLYREEEEEEQWYDYRETDDDLPVTEHIPETTRKRCTVEFEKNRDIDAVGVRLLRNTFLLPEDRSHLEISIADRWKDLYDVHEHYRLRQAILCELQGTL